MSSIAGWRRVGSQICGGATTTPRLRVPALDRLLAAAGAVPVALAVIPAAADRNLALRLRAAPQTAVLQHGWRHVNHGGIGRKSEFPAARSPAAVATDLVRGRVLLDELFGAQALPVLAPPWNRVADEFLPLLGDCGIRAVSRIKPRSLRWPSPGVFAANVHVDLVAWHCGRGFVGEALALGGIVAHLRERRRGEVDGREPTGILTHHLDLDDPGEAFLQRLVALTTTHPGACWLPASAVFGELIDAAGPA